MNNLTAERVNSALNGNDPALAHALNEADYIERAEFATTVTPHRTSGFFEQRWMTPIVNATCSWKDKLLAVTEVVRTNRKLKHTTIDEIMSELRDLPAVSPMRQPSDVSSLTSLMTALNNAFCFDRTGNQCLAYSHTLTRMARKRGIPVTLVLGVKTKPFFSHAWVEHKSEVVNDDRLLRQKLSVIMEG